MKLFLALAALSHFSQFTPQLIKKYSIQELDPGFSYTKPQVGRYVEMYFDGKFVNGTSLNPNYKRGKPLQFRIGKGKVFKCWDEVGLYMNRGQKVKVLCPSDTMYGSRAVGPIPANSDLVFIIERFN